MVVEWWERPLKILQFNIEDRYGTPLINTTSDDVVKLAEDLGVDAIVIFARDAWGRAFYRGSKVHPAHPQMREDFVRNVIEKAHEKGMKVILMVGHTADQYYFFKHTEWAQRNYKGEYIFLEHIPAEEERRIVPDWPQMCINSPFIDVIKEEVREAVSLGADMVFFDSFRFQPDIERACFCDYCRKKFKEDTGYEMITEPLWHDSRWRIQWEWRYDTVAERLLELKEVAGSVPVMYNAHPAGWSGRANRIAERARAAVDFVFAEASETDHQPPGFITEIVKLARALSKKPVAASRNYFHMYRTTAPTTAVAIRQGLRESMIAGGNLWILFFGNEFYHNGIRVPDIKEVFREHDLLEEYLTAEPYRYVGIVFSGSTMDHYGREHPYGYVDEVRGFYYALMHSHYPVQFISEQDAYEIRDYPVVILPNNVCVSRILEREIRAYVQEGGSLVSTFLTSAWPECIKEHALTLSDVFGVRLKGLLRVPWSYVTIPEWGINFPVVFGDMDYSFRKRRTEYRMAWHTMIENEAKGFGKVGFISQWSGPEYTLGRSPPPLGVFMDMPFVVENSYGEGRSIYFTGQIGRHYWRVGLPVFRKMILTAIERLAGRPPVFVEAPETLQVEYYRDGERWIIHLLNHSYNQRIPTTSIGTSKQPLPPFSSSGTVHPIREVIPLEATVKLPEGRWRVTLPLREKTEIAEKEYKVGVKEYEVVVLDPL